MFNGNLITFLCLIDQVNRPLYMRKIPLGVRPVFVFIFRLILVFSKTTKKHLQFYFFQNKQYKIFTKRLFNEMFALKNQKSLALLFCFPFQMQEVYHVEFEEYFRRILLNMNLSFGDFFFFNQAICYSLLCFKFICMKMHSTFTF